jgi:hypothetical protein
MWEPMLRSIRTMVASINSSQARRPAGQQQGSSQQQHNSSQASLSHTLYQPLLQCCAALKNVSGNEKNATALVQIGAVKDVCTVLTSMAPYVSGRQYGV